jgi:hypothetical protein
MKLLRGKRDIVFKPVNLLIETRLEGTLKQ